MRVRLPVCVLGSLSFALAASAISAEPLKLRIGLDKDFAHATTLLVASGSSFTIKDAASGKPIAHGTDRTVFRITPTDTGLCLTRQENGTPSLPAPLAVPLSVATDGQSDIRIARLDRGTTRDAHIDPRWHRYRGMLTVRREPDGTLQAIDTVRLEQYLYGVIPAEIGARVPMEAMKAQAVAARTYALKNRGKFAAEGYDLDDTTRCEGYMGVEGETALSNAAVDATRGEVLTYGSNLIDAPYSTDSGGMTACDSSGQCPYLQAVRDAPSKDAPDYAEDGKYHTWSKLYTPTQIAQALARDPRTRVDNFVSLAVDGADASGRITTATVAGADGTLKTVTGPQLRQILGYDVLRSTRVTLTVNADGSYQFDGRGWGHGLGMSQEGAVAMAAPPYRKSYRQILAHYYVGAELAPVGKLHDLTLASAPRGL